MIQKIYRKNRFKRIIPRCTAAFLAVLFAFTFFSNTAFADDLEDARQLRMGITVQTNEIADWPQGPAIGAEAAILMEAKTGAILYAKNIDEKLYPASTTKIMTGLLAYENAKLDDEVVFSYDAVHSVAKGDSNIGMDAGEMIPMNKALEGMMILSANEVANGIAETVGGTMDGFVQMMNDKAAEIGCTNTHFTNPNGLHDENHYTTCRDLALIAKYYFSYDYLAGLSREPSCKFEKTPTQPDEFQLNTKNMLVKGKKYEYEYLLGSKTGYTSEARQTLVSAAKKDGMELICVIMKEESPYQFEDTVALFQYGFENFKRVNIADNQQEESFLNAGFFGVGQDIFGSNKSILNVDPTAFVVLPKNGDFAEVEYDLSYQETGKNSKIAKVAYTFHGNLVGVAALNMNAEDATLFEQFAKEEEITDTETAGNSSGTEAASEEGTEESSEDAPKKPTTNVNNNGIFINVKRVLIGLGAIAAVSVLGFSVYGFIKDRKAKKRRRNIVKRSRNRRRGDDFK